MAEARDSSDGQPAARLPAQPIESYEDELTPLALTLLRDWKQFLHEQLEDSERNHGIASQHPMDTTDEDGEALGRFIDTMASLTLDQLRRGRDNELSLALRLVFEIDDLLGAIVGDSKQQIVRDAFSAAMMNLAALMTRRGHSTTLPKIRLQ